MFCGLRPGFGTAEKTDFGWSLPISVSEDDAGSHTPPLCVGAHSDGHVRWIRSVGVERRYVLAEGVFSMFAIILDTVGQRLVLVNLLMQVAVMALRGVG